LNPKRLLELFSNLSNQPEEVSILGELVPPYHLKKWLRGVSALIGELHGPRLYLSSLVHPELYHDPNPYPIREGVFVRW
jgi:hypothetical protein